MNYELVVYKLPNGHKPFEDWLMDLDEHLRNKMRACLNKLRLGNFNNCESVGNGLLELKIYTGPGYRIYFYPFESINLLVLFAGTKRTQQKDIEKAKEYLQEFKLRGKNEKKR